MQQLTEFDFGFLQIELLHLRVVVIIRDELLDLFIIHVHQRREGVTVGNKDAYQCCAHTMQPPSSEVQWGIQVDSAVGAWTVGRVSSRQPTSDSDFGV